MNQKRKESFIESSLTSKCGIHVPIEEENKDVVLDVPHPELFYT